MIEELISIIIPCYNAEKYIMETLESVKKQTYTNFEVIIINDKSTDNSKEMIEEYIKKDSRFRLINLTRNGGVSNARNKGIEVANGKYIAFLDSDDIWLPNKLSEQLHFMEENELSFTCTAYKLLDNNTNKKKTVVPARVIDFDTMLYGNQIACFTVMINRDLLSDIRFEKIHHEDYKFWLHILKKNEINCYSLEKPLGIYRKSSQSLSGNKIKAAIWTFKIIWNEIPNKFKIVKYFIAYILKSVRKHYI